MFGTGPFVFIKKEPGTEDNDMGNMQHVLESYMTDDRTGPVLYSGAPSPSLGGAARVALEEQVNDVSEKTLPVADDAWQRVEEYEKDAILSTGHMDILQQRAKEEKKQRTRTTKKKRGSRRKKRERATDGFVPDPPDELQQTLERPPTPEIHTQSMELGDIMSDLPIETLRQEALRNDSDARFLTRESILQRIPEEAVASVIKYQDVMKWVSNMIERPLWFRNLPRLAVETGTDIPELEVLVWKYLQDFLREPDPTAPWERPCLPPVDQNGRHFACESERMGGVRLREFLKPTQWDLVRRSVQDFRDKKCDSWAPSLPRHHQMCFLCRQYYTTTAFARRNFFEKQRKNTAIDSDSMTIIHDYIMAVNVPGEWDIDATLPGYEKPCGLAGPVVGHDRNDYVSKNFQRGNEPSTMLDVWLADNDNRNYLIGWTMLDRVFFQTGATRAYADRQ